MIIETSRKGSVKCAYSVPRNISDALESKIGKSENIWSLEGLSGARGQNRTGTAISSHRILRSASTDLSTDFCVDNFLSENLETLENTGFEYDFDLHSKLQLRCLRNKQKHLKLLPSVPIMLPVLFGQLPSVFIGSIHQNLRVSAGDQHGTHKHRRPVLARFGSRGN